jgi:hypothetical protein
VGTQFQIDVRLRSDSGGVVTLPPGVGRMIAAAIGAAMGDALVAGPASSGRVGRGDGASATRASEPAESQRELTIHTPVGAPADPPPPNPEPPDPLGAIRRVGQALGSVGATLSGYIKAAISAAEAKRAAIERAPAEKRERSGPGKRAESRAESSADESGGAGSTASAVTWGETAIEIDEGLKVTEWIEVPEAASGEDMRTTVPEASAKAAATPFAVASAAALLMASFVERGTAGRRRREASADSSELTRAEEDEHA